jgi:dinuclear metal center YbgI/SA1388 family protein
MMDINAVLSRIEQTAPPRGAAAWDNSGIQIAGLKEEVRTLAVSLDPLPGAISHALELGAELILTHHPLAMEPRPLNKVDNYHKVAAMVLGQGACLYAAHTSLDAQSSGPVGWLAEELKLKSLQVLEHTHVSQTLNVSIRSLRSHPSLIGCLRALHYVSAVEEIAPGEIFLTCPSHSWTRLRDQIVQELADDGGHFFTEETGEPAEILGFGLVGALPAPLPWKDFVTLLGRHVPREFWSLCGPEPENVATVAYCTGSGSPLADQAFEAGADVFITGDVKYHAALEAKGLIIDVGHYILEEEMMRRFATSLQADLEPEGVEVVFLPGKDPFRMKAPGA